MKGFILAAFAAALCLCTADTASAQLGPAHFKAWDKHAGTRQAVPRRAVRGKRLTYKSTRVARTRSDIRAKISPAIARAPVLQAVGAPIAAMRTAAAQILPHPAGCPRRLFCGCGAAIEVFGTPVRHLWLAANWLKYPAASPGPGMVAANRRHVMVIKQYLGNGKALVYDANSGGGLTRLHVRSLAGYSIRNPRA